MPSDVQLFLESGVDAVCYKPLNTKQFITHIEHTYHNRSYNSQTTTEKEGKETQKSKTTKEFARIMKI